MFISVFVIMLETVRYEVEKLLWNDKTWHAMDHIQRVESLALHFSETEKGDSEFISLIALLHDVDDYKLVGEEASQQMLNTKRILQSLDISSDKQELLLSEIASIWYSKSLKGISPKTLEWKIVSDADRCDSMGVMGILRTYQYSIIHDQPFFDKTLYPATYQNAQEYMTHKNNTALNHIFEKLLKLKNGIFTEAWKKEAEVRHQWMIQFLKEFFRENEMFDWEQFLEW